MSETIGYQQVCGMLNSAADQICKNHDMLSKLDSAVGDGDHGTTILRAMEAVSKTVSEHPQPDLKALLLQFGDASLEDGYHCRANHLSAPRGAIAHPHEEGPQQRPRGPAIA